MKVVKSMTYQSLYRKYRPTQFEDVIGQETIVKSLENSIIKNKISHAYLFTGPRGTGKTTMAKLMAKSINCADEDKVICGQCESCKQADAGSHPDIVEIDAASNNGVEEIRTLIERVKFTPIIGDYKVYIIDEVHMLSQGAFNALLKTLEEPPSHVVFILATTEIHKVLPTIISRCQRYDFSRIDSDSISKRLDKIVESENREIEKGASSVIASLSGGGMRNALTILEQALILNDDLITKDAIYEQNGMILPKEKIALFDNIITGNLSEMLAIYNNMLQKTVDVARLIMDLVKGIKDSIVYQYTGNLSYIDQNEEALIIYLHNNFETNLRIEMINTLLDYHEKIRFSSSPQLHMEIALIEIFESLNKNKVFKSVEKEVEAEIEESFEEEKVSSEIEKEFSQIELSEEEIVRLMVSADKEERFKDSENLNQLDNYLFDPNWAKVSKLLKGSQIVLSGNRFVVFATRSDIQARAIMDRINHEDLLRFTELLFGDRKEVFAINTAQFENSVNLFKSLYANSKLPKPYNDEDFDLDLEPVKDETEEKLVKLFGSQLKIEEI